MLTKLFNFLRYEQTLLEELVRLAERQQKSLVKFDVIELEEITAYQEELAKSLRLAEEQRIGYLMAWLGLNRVQAIGLKLSAIEHRFSTDEANEIKKIRLVLRTLIVKLQALNNTNRMLSNRARNSVKDMMSIFTNGKNNVCNVRV